MHWVPQQQTLVAAPKPLPAAPVRATPKKSRGAVYGALLHADHRKALFLTVAQILMVASYPVASLIGGALALSAPGAGRLAHNTIDPAINWVVRKARSSILLTVVGAGATHMIATKGLMLEVVLLPEVLVEFWLLWAVVWPLGVGLALCVGLRLFVQNAAALPPSAKRRKSE